ncbi:hypothetical protein QZH41_004291 [Actinostola sp. cb2023]|nr:hypothetical protein QZH41_004291 [Actinostola sp. cb2023]
MKLVNGVVKPVKGKVMTVRVSTDIRKVQLLRKAIDRHEAYDRKFERNAGYTLAYPDGTEILTLPGQPSQLFQLNKYEDVEKNIQSHLLLLGKERRSSKETSATLEDVLVFITETSMPPPLGFDTTPTIEFTNGTLPTANTCATTLHLPTVYEEYDLFKAKMDFAILNSPCFGQA